MPQFIANLLLRYRAEFIQEFSEQLRIVAPGVTPPMIQAYIEEIDRLQGEPYIDRYVLPKFMRFIEAHVYTRGYVYRYGGDEYSILLNNVTEDEALDSMERLRHGLAELTYEGVERRTTVSVGVVIVRPDCHLTGHEIEHAAASAKAFAKNSGRNCVASYVGSLFREEDLRIVGPASSA